MTVTQGNQVLIVKPNNNDEDVFIQKFMRDLVSYKMVKKGPKLVFEIKDRYYVNYIYNNSYVILSTYVEDFVFSYVHKFGKSNLKVKLSKKYVNKKIDLDFKSDFLPRDEQQFFIDGMMKTLEHNRVLVMARTGYGKDLRNGTLVKTPTGWLPINELVVGNLVIGDDGSWVRVKGIYPQGIKQQVRLTFTGDRTVDCGLEHSWDISLDGKKFNTVMTEDIISLLDKHTITIPRFSTDDKDVELLSYEDIGNHESTCIVVDNKSSLFVIKGNLVTHNTYMANLVISKMRYGTLLYLKPTYIAKWVRDLKEYFDIMNGDIFVIRGSKSFCELAKMKVKPKFVIVSSSTFHNYMDYYANTIKRQSKLYCIPPNKLMKVLNLHTLLTDETHKNFNNIFRAILTLDPKKVIGLTATLITKDKKLSQFHYKLFPKENRLDLLKYRTFIKLENVSYKIDTSIVFKVKNMFGYNHKAYEKYILTRKPLRDSFLEMIEFYINKRYINVKQKGDKALVFVSSLDMVALVTKHLQKAYPTLDIRPFTGDDKYDNALEPDIRISHPQVLAEAIDIDSLIYTLNTVNIDSIATYIQMIGRLRYIKDKDTWFTQMYTPNVPQHYKYIYGNQPFIEDVVEEYNSGIYPKRLNY